MKLTSQQRSDLARVRGDGNPDILLLTQNLIQHGLVSDVLVISTLLEEVSVELIFLLEAFLELVSWPSILDVGLGSTSVTGVSADTLTKVLLYDRDKRLVVRKFELAKSEAGGLEAAGEWGGVVGIWVGNLLQLETRFPVFCC